MRPRRRFALRRLIARPTESEHPGAPINQPNTILKATKFAKTAIMLDQFDSNNIDNQTKIYTMNTV
ncbi:hypothetical protein A6K24_11645 [Metabacillus litoralis]|uniref:Uncharacterized protein n=1 Tax=Metabacillus litoralis TaxID=152268 RepID=A0A179SN52_9BACI|nr:hypothetical protein A6K24_11645 [Metabacillus litoralis]